MKFFTSFPYTHALMLCTCVMICCTVGCRSDKPQGPAPVVVYSAPASELRLESPYFIRVIEKNGADVMDIEHPATRYVASAKYPEYVQKQFIPLNEIISEYIQEKVDDFSDVMQVGTYQGTLPKDSLSEMSIHFTPYHYTSGFASVLFEGFEETPDIPEGFHYYRSFNYDALNGQILSLRDCVVGEEEFAKLANLVAQKIKEQNLSTSSGPIRRATDPENPDNFNLFIIRPGEFIIYFHPYQITRKNSDLHSITVNFSEVEVQPYLLDIISYHPIQ